MLTGISPRITLHNFFTNNKSGKKSDDGEYNLSKSSKSTKINKAASITNLRNERIKIKKVFATISTKIEETKNEEFYLTDSDDDDK